MNTNILKYSDNELLEEIKRREFKIELWNSIFNEVIDQTYLTNELNNLQV